MEKISWKVEGMTCSNCALSVQKVLQKQGMEAVKVNAISGDVSFDCIPEQQVLEQAKNNINDLGYHVVDESLAAQPTKRKGFLSTYLQKFWFCLPFTLVLMIGHWAMAFGNHFLHNGWLQLVICLPVMVVGMLFFGKSAFNSLRKGIPNMNVLVAMGALAAFIYSLVGTITQDGDKLFYETAASIITIVLFGNWLEHYSVAKTQRAIQELTKREKVMAHMIAYDDAHNENIFPIENTYLKVGDLILIKTGEQVPQDCKILSGDAEANEAIISGESVPVNKKQGDILIGGSLLVNGVVKCYVTASGKDTILNGIVAMMKQAQGQKPPVQLLADKISAVFVPVVIGISLLTFAGNYLLFHQVFSESLMRSIAVLVISCPCAMGLATPAAIAVGLGRAAKNGILFTQPESMERFAQVKQIVFDKTGTLTTGEFSVSQFQVEPIFQESIDELAFKQLVYSMEKYSSHPIAKSIAKAWKSNQLISWKKIKEVKGLGMEAEDKAGNFYQLGSNKIEKSITDDSHHLYLLKNKQLIGWLDIADELRPEAATVVKFCKDRGLKTILLSGDKWIKCNEVAAQLGIDEVLAEQSPEQKLAAMDRLCKAAPTVMVGDGINDAPALAKATISISLSAASQLAIESASVVLMNSGLQKLPMAMQLGVHTYNTVKGNLFWAFIYNVLAIPFAAIGLFTPTAGALLMGLSDVVLAANSLRLNWKKIVD